ncbi:hypothetical protein PS850_06233 [Pseudomonas fluorescens]|nr:hypothetical protein PS850_06233 [Pseudomonas fluorescens]
MPTRDDDVGMFVVVLAVNLPPGLSPAFRVAGDAPLAGRVLGPTSSCLLAAVFFSWFGGRLVLRLPSRPPRRHKKSASYKSPVVLLPPAAKSPKNPDLVPPIPVGSGLQQGWVAEAAHILHERFA